MLCSGLVCISLSLVSTFVLTTILQRRDAVEPVVSREDRLELRKDVDAAEVLAAVAVVLYMSYLWRALFCRPAPQPQPALQDFKEEREHELPPLRRPSEHKETQCQSLEEAEYITAETQTSDCLLPAGWTSSDSHFSDSSLSEIARPSDTQMDTAICVSPGTIQQSTAEAQTGGTLSDYPQTLTTQALLEKETALDCMVQQVLELQLGKMSQTSGGPQGNPPISNDAPYLPAESLRIETSEEFTSLPATNPQNCATSVKAQLPPNAADFDTPPNSASDVSSPDADMGLIVIREPAGHGLRKQQTLTVSLATDQSPRLSTPPPRPPESSISGLPVARKGPFAGRRPVTCRNCRPLAGSQGKAEATVKVTAVPSSAAARGGGDAPQVQARQLAGRGGRPQGKSNQAPGRTYMELHCRPGSAAYGGKPPFL